MDPISFEIYRIFCKYAIETVDIFVWAYKVIQLSCITRSISIDDLTFGQIALGINSLVIKYCDSKYDQKGKITSSKNYYCNPFDYLLCIFTALGCYLCIHGERWTSHKDTTFRNWILRQLIAPH